MNHAYNLTVNRHAVRPYCRIRLPGGKDMFVPGGVDARHRSGLQNRPLPGYRTDHELRSHGKVFHTVGDIGTHYKRDGSALLQIVSELNGMMGEIK